jgi:VanZ family protein
MSKVFSVATMALLVFVALGPATWQPRSGLGFELDHFVGYFVFTLMFCLAWPRPLAVGGALVVFALVLENLQSLLPDRSSYFVAASLGLPDPNPPVARDRWLTGSPSERAAGGHPHSL